MSHQDFPKFALIFHPEFDALDIHARCIEDNVTIFLESCMLHLTRKRLWCVDCCIGLAKKCEKGCADPDAEASAPYSCHERCCAPEALDCAEHCAVKGTPFEQKTSPAG